MKILPVSKIREADEYTIRHEPIADIDLMERAATECFAWITARIDPKKTVHVFAGTGNNGGDGLAVARMLVLNNYQVWVYVAGTPDKLSPSCKINYSRFCSLAPDRICLLEEGMAMPEIREGEIVIDSIFGNGLTRPASGLSSELIRHINQNKGLVISIDLPSGLFCDISYKPSGKPPIVKADYTLCFSPPKIALFLAENDEFLGSWHLLQIGISEEFIEKTEVRNHLIDSGMIMKFLKSRNRHDHKGSFGHALLICGSYGKMGAAVLAAKAALRCGAGLVTVHSPSSGVNILQTAIPEAMTSIDPDEIMFSKLPGLSPYNAIGTGSGMGQGEKSAKALKLLIQEAGQPLIFDADAINLLSENKTWLGFIPRDSIFTPHPKEFQRLAGKHENDHDRLQRQKDFSYRYHCYTVLKGAYTSITTPGGDCFFNSSGNPGMATAGSGDVLTGMITGLKARGYSSLESCLLGVYLHGTAGDLAAADMGQEAMIAGDIIDNIGKAFHRLYGKL